MGCGEGELEKKARKFGWRKVVGGLGVAASVAGAVVWAGRHFYNKGHENGYAEGRTAGVLEGKEAIMQDAYLEVKTQQFPRLVMKDAYGHLGDYSFSAGYCKWLNENMTFSKPDGEYRIYDFDGSVDDNNAESFLVQHDGLVDVIDTPTGTLIRERDYEANQALFNEADNLLKQKKEELATKQ